MPLHGIHQWLQPSPQDQIKFVESAGILSSQAISHTGMDAWSIWSHQTEDQWQSCIASLISPKTVRSKQGPFLLDPAVSAVYTQMSVLILAKLSVIKRDLRNITKSCLIVESKDKLWFKLSKTNQFAFKIRKGIDHGPNVLAPCLGISGALLSSSSCRTSFFGLGVALEEVHCIQHVPDLCPFLHKIILHEEGLG